MNFALTSHIRWTGAGILLLLIVASAIGWVLQRRVRTAPGRATVENLNARIRAWWAMVVVFGLAYLGGAPGVIGLFVILSFLGLREFITLTPSRRGDHRALFWAFFVIIPLHYAFIFRWWYGMFSIFIPVYVFLFLPIRMALAGDCEHFLERSAKTQWGLMVCVYCLSHAAALMKLEVPQGPTGELLLFLVIVTQMSDVFQYVWGKLLGRHKIAPTVSPNKTWEGLIGGGLTATALGGGLWWLTPFGPLCAVLFAAVVTLAGFFGGLVMSAIKRDRGVKDFGTLIEGHGGVLDRLDSLCFAAPVFFHLVRYFCT